MSCHGGHGVGQDDDDDDPVNGAARPTICPFVVQALDKMLAYGDPEHVFARYPDGRPITAAAMRRLLEEGAPEAISFVEDVHGAALRVLRMRQECEARSPTIGRIVFYYGKLGFDVAREHPAIVTRVYSGGVIDCVVFDAALPPTGTAMRHDVPPKRSADIAAVGWTWPPIV